MARAIARTAPPLEPARARALGHNVAWTLIGRVLYAGGQFAMLAVIARLAGVEAVGAFAFAIAVTAPPMVFANLQLRSLYATDVDDRFAWSTWWRVRIVATTLALAVCLALVPISGIDPHGPIAGAIAMVAVAKAIETLSDLHYGAFQRHGQMQRFGRSLALRGGTSVLALWAVLAAGGSLTLALAAWAGCWAAILIVSDAPAAARLRTGTARSGAGASRLLAHALPLGVVFLLDSIHQNIPRWFVEARLGSAELGRFMPVVYAMTIGTALVFAMCAPRAPHLARRMTAGDAAGFTSLALGLLARTAVVGVLGIATAAIAGEPLVRLAFGEAFAVERSVLIWLAIAAALHFVTVAAMTALVAARALLVQPLCYVAAIATATAASAMWLPEHGLRGAAWASACGMAVGATGALLALARVCRPRRVRA